MQTRTRDKLEIKYHVYHFKREIDIIHTVIKNSGGSRIPQSGASTPEEGAKSILIGKIFDENCMRMKEIGPTGGRADVPSTLLDPPMNENNYFEIILFPKNK